jgi:chemotaxis protein methyltransferase CheR
VQSGAFFREPYHLEILSRTVLPGLARDRGRKHLRLWSAGCGSGETVWSLAMILAEADLPSSLDVTVLGTDADPALVARAREAVYTEHRMAGVSAERRRRHFVRGTGPRQGLWRVVAPLRDQVELAELDLAGPWPAMAPFDVVVCHDPAALGGDRAARLIGRLADALAPGGVLLLGATEAVPDRPDLALEGRAAYRKTA